MMIADPKKSESKAKAIAGQLPNRLPMRDSAFGAASGLCTEARCSISSPNHEIALFEIPAALRPRADDLSPESIDVCSRKGHLNQPTAKGGPATRGLMTSIDASGRSRWQVPSPVR